MKIDEPLENLRKLVISAKAGALPIKDFCTKFERIYNLELDKNSVPKNELRAFAALFDKVVWYSPIAEERARIPHYLGEDDIRLALAQFDVRIETARINERDTPAG